jgi:hypothetical protein
MSATHSEAPKLQASGKASPPFFVEHDYEGVVDEICDLVYVEDSDLWRHMGEVLERVVPGIDPYTRRELTEEMLAPIRKVYASEF